MTNHQSYRYAVYFAGEPKGEFWRLGSKWLGRCATGESVESFPVNMGIDSQLLRRMTSQPRRYGWHATLKAPFSLRDDVPFFQLDETIKRLTQELTVFDLPCLVIKKMKNFLALAPLESTQLHLDLKTTGSRCVEALHQLAKPLNESEIAYRKSSGLTKLEEGMMLQWGYPFVHDLFEFHFTLSNGLEQFEAHEVKALEDAAHLWFNPEMRIRFDRVSLFVEDIKGSDFKFLKDYCI